MILNELKKMVIRSNGKLMLTGEYLVLRGAESLTLPLSKGQTMKISQGRGVPSLSWRTNINGCYWFDARFSIPDFAIANTNDFPTAQIIRELIIAARKLNSNFLSRKIHYEVQNDLEFNINWGLGSSSSLINNLAHWAQINPFDLHYMVSEGSGYDIAAAGLETPFIYSIRDNKPVVRKVLFDPVYKDRLYFVYSGKKVSTAAELKRIGKLERADASMITEVSDITRKIAASVSYPDFVRLLERHENIISDIIGKKPVGKTDYRDFSGTVKSLGVWGGDFVLFISDYPREYVVSYLRRKDLKIWFRYEDIIAWPKSGAHEGKRYTT